MQKNLTTLGVIAILGASLAISGFVIQDVMAAPSANKSAFNSDAPAFISTSSVDNRTGVIASTQIKASNPQDVLVLYNEECSLYTELNLKGKKSEGSVDGISMDEVNVSHSVELFVNEKSIGGPITMCDRTYGMQTNILDQIEDICDTVNLDPDTETQLSCDPTFLNTWINTKAAHGWSWVVVNTGDIPDPDGDGLQTISIIGTVVDEDDPNEVNTKLQGVVIGKRSLIVIPTHLDVSAQQ